MTTKDKVNSKLNKAKENSGRLKDSYQDKASDDSLFKVVVAGVFSIVVGGLVGMWKISSDQKED